MKWPRARRLERLLAGRGDLVQELVGEVALQGRDRALGVPAVHLECRDLVVIEGDMITACTTHGQYIGGGGERDTCG